MKVERSEEVQRITKLLKQPHLAQGITERRWKDLLKSNEEDLEISKVKFDDEKASGV